MNSAILRLTLFFGRAMIVLTILGTLGIHSQLFAQTYPPETKLTFKAVPAGIARSNYLVPMIDPTFGTQITRIGDVAKFGVAKPYHHYSKDQPWNSDGTLIMMDGWPAAILDGKTLKKIREINPSGDHHVWSNTNPNIIYGCSANKFESQSPASGVKKVLHTFTEYTSISLGDWEGNISNDDQYAALRCAKSGINYVVVYNILKDSVVAVKNIGSRVPNNVAISQSGKYVAIQWNVDGTGSQEGITIHKSSDLSYVRQVSFRGGTHYDLGYDTKGNEVCCMSGDNRGIIAVNLENGSIIQVTKDADMSWPIHISCRNLNRPGWLYLTDFAASYGETTKPNYQQVYAVKIDGSNTVNCFGHVHHSTREEYDRSPFGVPNRDGSIVMFRSDWNNANGEIDSYVATMLPDSIPPAKPTGLNVPVQDSKSFTLNWEASADNIMTKNYEVFVDGARKGSTTGLTWVVKNLTEYKTYLVTVKAFDFTGNISEPSYTLLVVITPPLAVNMIGSAKGGFDIKVNPGQNSITINSERADDSLISVFDVTGRKIFERRLTKISQETLDLKALSNKTLYILRIQNIKNQSVTRKIFRI